jgi:hypothetical protein
MGNLAALLHTFSFFFAPPFVPNIVEPPVAAAGAPSWSFSVGSLVAELNKLSAPQSRYSSRSIVVTWTSSSSVESKCVHHGTGSSGRAIGDGEATRVAR